MLQDNYLTPSFLNAAELFVTKYLNSSTLNKKSESDNDIFLPSTHKYNLLIEKLHQINLCIKDDDLDCYIIDIKPYRNFNVKQLVAYNYIKEFTPPWFIRFRKGIDALVELENIDRQIFQCLNEIEIFNYPLTNSAEDFITQIRKLIYASSFDERDNIDTGVIGEKLSMKYELIKSGTLPTRESLNNEYAGYDLISFYSDNQIKRIEVKASKSQRAFITWNEWKVALDSNKEGIDYEFHLWNIKDEKNELAILCLKDLSFIPKEHCDRHHFDKYIILFDGFSDKFQEVSLN